MQDEMETIRTRLPKLVPVALVWVILISWTASASSFSLSGDWSSTTNPNGPWSYNQGTTPLPLVPGWGSIAAGGCNQPAWAPSANVGNFLPGFMQPNSCALSIFGIDPNNGLANVMAGDIVTHTVDGFNGNLALGVANFKFTLPGGGGAYQISGFVWDAALNTGTSRPQDWELLVNGVEKASGLLIGNLPRSEAETFNIVAGLSAGDTVDLELYMDSSSSAGYYVGTNMSISEVSTIPEPSTFALLGSGLLFFGTVLRRTSHATV